MSETRYIEEDFPMCGTDECEYNEDGFCMKENYYADCPYEY